MMENHSFDNFFGTYPVANGANNSQIETPVNLLNFSNEPSLVQIPSGNSSTEDPNEGLDTYHADWDNGKMDGFAQYSGAQAMTYFTSAQLAIEWDWAEEYSLGDMYFSSVLSDTVPNRLMSMAGQTPVTADYGPPPYLPVNQTVMYQLSNSWVSWGYYIDNPASDWYPINYFSGINEYSQNIQSWTSFFSSLQNGTLPSISWVMPVGGGEPDVSQHPTQNVTKGELWLANVVNSVMQSPYWNSTAIFITYDEGGGYYDQVPPPVVDGTQLGFRVPFLVISPYAKEDYVSSTVLNHDSILAFIEYNWGLPALNGFIGSSNIPLDMFDFSQSYPNGSPVRAPVVVPQSANFPLPFQIPVSSLPYSRSGSSSIVLASSSISTTQFASSSESSSTTFLSSTTSSPASSIQLGSILAVMVIFLLITGSLAAILVRRQSKRV